MRVNLAVLSRKIPIGGNIALYELANELSALGLHLNLLHCGLNAPTEVEGIEDIPWFDFAPEIEHFFMGTLEYPVREVPPADVISTDWSGRPSHAGKPFQFIQGKGIFGKDVEAACYLNDQLKICVSRWLVDVGIELGAEADTLLHVPLGVRHEKYRCITPPEDRSSKVALCFHRSPLKRVRAAIKVLTRVKEHMPELEVVAFGFDSRQIADESGIPQWVEYHQEPNQAFLISRVYNAAAVFLCTSRWEGFGMPSLEAMACGAALVTTDNGGSREFARHGETALVCQPGDVEGLARSVMDLLSNRALRLRVAKGGLEEAQRFSWKASAQTLASALQDYCENP
ncbi:MAG: glycosyltransferase family 4 protein [Pseudomonadota bacterium]